MPRYGFLLIRFWGASPEEFQGFCQGTVPFSRRETMRSVIT